jgi:hypothetical protein
MPRKFRLTPAQQSPGSAKLFDRDQGEFPLDPFWIIIYDPFWITHAADDSKHDECS